MRKLNNLKSSWINLFLSIQLNLAHFWDSRSKRHGRNTAGIFLTIDQFKTSLFIFSVACNWQPQPKAIHELILSCPTVAFKFFACLSFSVKYYFLTVIVPSSGCVPWMKRNLIILLAHLYSWVDGIIHSGLTVGLWSEMPQIQSEIKSLIYSSDV